MKRLIVIYISILCSCLTVSSQVHHLSLEQSVEIAKKQSFTMRKLAQELKMTEYQLQSATRQLKTHIDLNLTLPEYKKTIQQWEDSLGVSFFPVEQLNYAGMLSIRQPLPTNGNLFMESGLNTFNDYYTDFRSTNLNARIRLYQPLDAFYGYNEIKATLQRAELAYEQKSKSHKRSELVLVYRVSQLYYDLLSAQKQTEIAQLDLERQTEAYEISKKKYESGLIREVDALQMEVDLAESQNSHDIALFHQSSSANTFKEMLGIPLTDSIVLDKSLKYDIVLVDPDVAVKMAMDNRLDLREKDIDMIVQELNVKRQKANGMIKTGLNAYYERVGVSRRDLNEVGLGKSFDLSFQDFKHRPANYGVSLTISIPILDWGENRALVRSSKAQLKKLEIEKEELLSNIEVSVRNLAAKVSSNLKRLQSLEKNIEVAEKSFQITLSRFSDGDIDSQALALERNRLNGAYRNHLSAYIDYQLSLTDLMQQTFYDFKQSRKVE